MAFHYSPKIVRDSSLILYLDAGNARSYSGTGTKWLDLSKSLYDSTLNGATYDSGNGGSFQFNGTGNYASCGNISIGSKGTVNVWFKQDSAIANKGLVSIGADTIFYIGGAGAVTELQIFNGSIYSGGINLNSSTSWNFASFVWSGSTATVYLNGGSAISSSISFTTSGAVVIGAYGAMTNYFNGKISNVQIYNRDLSAAEVLQNYNAINPRFYA